MSWRDRGRDRTRDYVGLRAPDVRWERWLERLLLVFPVLVGAGVLGVLASGPVSILRRGVLAVVAVAAVSLRIGIPICLYLDASELSRSSVRWRPNRWLYAGGALLVSAPLAALVYLYRRYEHAPAPKPGRHWWLAVALAAFVAPASIAAGLVGDGVELATVLAVASTLAAGLLPIGIFRDAAYVTASDARWNPNPAMYLGFAYLALLVAVLQPALAAYYLGKRYRRGPGASSSGT